MSRCAITRSRLVNQFKTQGRHMFLRQSRTKRQSLALTSATFDKWVLDWAHIGRMLQYVDQAIAPMAYGRVTESGSAFELWDLFVRFRNWVWTGRTERWKLAGGKLYELLILKEQGERNTYRRQAHGALRKLLELLSYLEGNEDSLIDYSRWQHDGRRISTGFVESTINRVLGRRMCKGQQMRWSRQGAHCLIQVWVALINQELDAMTNSQFPWVQWHRITWPWQRASHPF